MFFISSQECEIIGPFLLRSYSKYVFLRARVPNMLGTWEHKTRNACPSLLLYEKDIVHISLLFGAKET